VTSGCKAREGVEHTASAANSTPPRRKAAHGLEEEKSREGVKARRDIERSFESKKYHEKDSYYI
jgi:hypothetical protein